MPETIKFIFINQINAYFFLFLAIYEMIRVGRPFKINVTLSFFSDSLVFARITFLTLPNAEKRSEFGIRLYEQQMRSHLRNSLRFHGAVEKASM